MPHIVSLVFLPPFRLRCHASVMLFFLLLLLPLLLLLLLPLLLLLFFVSVSLVIYAKEPRQADVTETNILCVSGVLRVSMLCMPLGFPDFSTI
jgi:hypothetical protein